MGKGLFSEFLRAGRVAKPFPDLCFIKGKAEARNGAGKATTCLADLGLKVVLMLLVKSFFIIVPVVKVVALAEARTASVAPSCPRRPCQEPRTELAPTTQPSLGPPTSSRARAR